MHLWAKGFSAIQLEPQRTTGQSHWLAAVQSPGSLPPASPSPKMSRGPESWAQSQATPVYSWKLLSYSGITAFP